jgi:hypothetical protein
MFRERTWWFTAALVVAFLNATAYASQHQYDSFRGPDMVRLPGHVLPALAKATVIPSKLDAAQ